MENVLQESCNAFFCQLGRLLGREGILAGLRRFGLAGPREKPDYIQGTWIQSPGFDKARWPLNRLGIGYGVRAAPLQIARAYAGIGTGRLPWLRIVDRIDGVLQPGRSEDLNIPARVLGRVQRGLTRVVTRGTGRGHGWLGRARVAGKTGTAILMLDGGKVKRYRAWFSGYYPRREPTLAFSCAFFGAREGGGKAAARAMDAFLASLDSHPRLRQYLPGFARSRRFR
jgi:cell division protein FtsI/penicillin-binding protein 2